MTCLFATFELKKFEIFSFILSIFKFITCVL